MFKSFVRIAATALLASVAVPSQAAVTFNFAFNAPLSNGDVAAGSGTLTTDDADANGVFVVRSATGSFRSYASQPDPITIDSAAALGPRFTMTPATIFADADGVFVTDNLFLSRGGFFFDGIAFDSRNGRVYGGGTGEVAVNGATLTFNPVLAGAVPEPATWAMMVIGFGAMGAALRRRQRVAVRFA